MSEFKLREDYEQDLYENDHEPLNKQEKIAIDCFIDWQNTRKQPPASDALDTTKIESAIRCYPHGGAFAKDFLDSPYLTEHQDIILKCLKAALVEQPDSKDSLHTDVDEITINKIKAHQKEAESRSKNGDDLGAVQILQGVGDFMIMYLKSSRNLLSGERVKNPQPLLGMLEKNYKTFCYYGKLHAAKDTDEGSVKSHKNLDIAEEIRITLAQYNA